MAPLRVHILEDLTPALEAHLRARLEAGVALTIGPTRPEPADYRLLVCGVPEEADLDASPALETLVIPWAGLPSRIRGRLLARPQLAVHNLHHNAAPAAELGLALLLTAAKWIVPADQALRRHDWTPRYAPNTSRLLAGKRALILGYGAIGRRLARGCRGLGMEVTALRRRQAPAEADCPDEVGSIEELRNQLPRADALLIALPLTKRTRGLIGARELAGLPAGALLINIARGAIVEEAALYDWLRADPSRGAGLDVWYRYPQREEERTATAPSAYPFHELDNVVLSPHRGGAAEDEEAEQLRMEALAATLNAAARGEPLPHPVDVAEGY